MIKLVVSLLIFLIAEFLYVYVKEKLVKNKKKENIVSYVFIFFFGIFNICNILYFYTYISGTTYSLAIIYCFIIGLLFDWRKNILFYVMTVIGIFLSKETYDGEEVYKIFDVLSSFSFALIGVFCQYSLYKKSCPNILFSVVYSLVLMSIYIAIVLIALVFVSSEEIVFGEIVTSVCIGLVTHFVVIFFSFCILNIFLKKVKIRDIIWIFIKKYSLIIVIYGVLAFIISYIFVNLYLKNNYKYIIDRNFSMAKISFEKMHDRYGENFMLEDNEAKIIFDTWGIEKDGAVYILDESCNMLNDYSKDFVNWDNEEIMAAENFNAIINYPQDQVFEYESENYSYMAKYKKIGKYYLLAFFPLKEMRLYSLIPALLVSFISIFNSLVAILVLYVLIKTYIAERMWIINKKLEKITSGDYNVIFDDKSSLEFEKLSSSINKTVATLKDNILRIEMRNKENLELARKIQQSQLPVIIDTTVAYNVYATNIPAEDVGGDFYEYFPLDYKNVLFLIADVSGKSVPAAMFMMKAKNLILNNFRKVFNFEKVFEKTNQLLCENNDAMMFVTCFACVLNLETGNLKYINAGHNTPLVAKNINGNYEYSYIDTKPDRIFGIDENAKYNVYEMKMNQNDYIFLYTDGITEARSINKKFYGEKRLSAAMNKLDKSTAKNICDGIINDVVEFVGSASQHDDMTLLCVKYNATKNRIVLNAILDDIDKGKLFLTHFLNIYNFDIGISRNLKVVYDEIFSNIMKHAYHNNGGELIFELNMIDKNTVEMVFMDKGEEFDLVRYDKAITSPEDKINGGMGILFCKNIMDKCEYLRKNEYNILKMYKKK